MTHAQSRGFRHTTVGECSHSMIRGRMTDVRRLALPALAGMLMLGALDAGAAEQNLKPSLRAESSSPLVLRGQRFRAFERVRLTVTARDETRRRIVRASRGGSFTASFREVGTDRCNSNVWALAVGHRGSTASLRLGKLPQLQCPPGIP